MQTIKITFAENYPLMGAMRQAGDILFEGTCPVKGITQHKLINALINANLKIEIVDEKQINSHGIGAVPGGGHDEPPVHNKKRSRK